MKKSILTLVLMLTAIAAGAQDFTVNGLTYKVTNMDSVTVKSYNLFYGKDVSIPATVTYNQETYKVTAIGDNAFNGKLIKSISIPASVEIIGEQAFSWNDSLQSIRIEDGDTPLTLVDAWYSTFNNGGAKYTVYVGRNLISMHRPDESPYPQATSITWGPKVTEIGPKDACCPYLRNAVISNSVKTIGHSAFLWAGNNSDSDALTITMGANVDSIAACAFQNCNKLTSIELPKGLKAIPDNCFYGTPLRDVVIPASVMSVGNEAFCWNDSLKSVTIEDSDKPITLIDSYYSTFNNGRARYIVYVGRNIERMYRPSETPFPQATTITWGPKVTAIGTGEGRSLFLTSAVINNSVKTIGAEAFYAAGNNSEAEGLTITMSAYVDSIGYSAFQDCQKLTSIELPKGLKAIPDACFSGTRIRDVVIPASVMSVGNQAFSWNDSIKTVTIEDNDKPITFSDPYYTTFDNGGARYTVYVGRNIERMYRPSESPFPQATTITWGSMVTAVGDGEGRSPFLKNAVIGNSVKTVGAEAFYLAGYSSEAEELLINMGANVDSIGYSAFLNCSKLKSIVLPKVLKAIPDNCFNGTRIKDVVIPASVMSVGNLAFNWNDSIKTVTIEDSDKPITFYDSNYTTFDNGGAKYTVYVGRNIERYYRPTESPFPQATSITWGPKVTVIGDGEGKSAFLRAAVINNSVKTIGASAFDSAGNSSDTDELLISMGLYVEEFGSSAFYNCLKLKNIYIPKVLKAIPDNCFNGTRIKDVVIPASVMSVGDQAFSWNDSIKTIRIEDSDKSITFNDPYYTTFDNGGARYTVYQGRNIERTFRPSESPFPQAESVAFGAQVTELGSGMYNCVNIKNIIAPWETPISINSDVFNSGLYGSAILYVPRKHLDSYKAAPVWKNFLSMEEMEETKCYTPTATLENGRLHFECETKDVTFHYKYTYPEGREGTGNDIGVGQTINLTLYATKAGLEDSDKAVYELEISGGGSIVGIRGDVNQDGEVNVGDMVVISNIMSGNE